METKLLLTAAVFAATCIFFSVDPFRVFSTTTLPPSRQASEKLQDVRVIPLAGATGPESLAFDGDGGGPYTGVSDGRILKWLGEGHGWQEFAVSPPHLTYECRGSQDPKMEHVCGRPLGLRFNEKTGDLYIADAYLGLLLVHPDANLTEVVATQAHAVPFHFTNGLDIDQETEIVYFTDSSIRFQRRDFILAIVTGDRSGRVMKYNPRTKEVQVLLDGLSFPNGVALSKDGSFLLIAETTSCRILRYWLETPKAGSVEVFIQLPGFPDNIKRSPRGGFWVGLHSKRTKFLEWALSSLPWLGEMLVKLPLNLERLLFYWGKWRGQALAIRLSEGGEVLEMLGGIGEKSIRSISEIEEKHGSLWIGSVAMPHMGVYKI